MLDCRVIIGTQEDDTVLGTPTCDVMSGCSGDDVIRGMGGNDILFGEEGANIFAYSALPESGLPEKGTYHEGVDTLLFFSQSEGDQVDFSALSAGLDNGLKFSGTTPEPYAVYYAVGVDPDYDIVTKYNLGTLVAGDPFTLMADLDGNPQSPEVMAIMWGSMEDPLTPLTASDLVL